MNNQNQGKWEADDEFCIYQDGRHIVSVHAKPNETGRGLDWGEASERLALIAAAPDLLAALRQCYSDLQRFAPNSAGSIDARAAIAKAEGK